MDDEDGLDRLDLYDYLSFDNKVGSESGFDAGAVVVDGDFLLPGNL